MSPGARTVSCVLHHPRARGWAPATPRTGTKLRSPEQPPRLRRPTTLSKPSARWGKARAELGAAAMRLLSRYHCDGEDAHQKLCDGSASPFLREEERELGSECLSPWPGLHVSLAHWYVSPSLPREQSHCSAARRPTLLRCIHRRLVFHSPSSRSQAFAPFLFSLS